MERKHRATRTTSHKLTIAGLLTKRREMAGEVEKARERFAECETAIVHLDAVLALFGVEDGPDFRPLRRMDMPRVNRTVSRDRQRAILAALRDAPNGLTTPVIAATVASDYKHIDGRQRTREGLVSEVRKVLHRLEVKGVVRRFGYQGEARIWRMA